MDEQLLKTPEQLDVGSTTSIGSTSWGGQTGGIGSVMGSSWAERIIFDAQPDRVLSKYFLEFEDLMHNNDVTIVIPKIGDVNLMGGRGGSAEGSSRVMTKFDSADNITVSLTSADVKLGGCAVAFETASATRVSIIEMAHKQLVRQYLNTIETDANSILENAGANVNTVYGGDATSVTELTAGDIVSVDKLVDMKIELMKDDYAKRPGEGVVFLYPTQFKELLKSPQFTNAMQFGTDQVVRKGVIEEYVGVKIETSTLVSSSASQTSNTGGDTWGASGHMVYMIDPSAAAAIVWKEKAKVKVVTEDDERVHKVLLDAWYRMTRVQDKAICLGYFTDA